MNRENWLLFARVATDFPICDRLWQNQPVRRWDSPLVLIAQMANSITDAIPLIRVLLSLDVLCEMRYNILPCSAFLSNEKAEAHVKTECNRNRLSS